MTGLIDSTLDELDAHIRDLRREVSRLERFRRQLDATEDQATCAAPPQLVPEGEGAAAE
jgi:hypothetical protein